MLTPRDRVSAGAMIIRPRIDRHATEDQLRNLAEALVPAFGPADVLSTLEGSKGAITVASKNGIALSCFVRGILLESNSFSFASEFHRYEQLAAGQRLACLAEAHRVGGKQQTKSPFAVAPLR
jgi:hypothetical protein